MANKSTDVQLRIDVDTCDVEDKVQKAIARFKAFEPPEGYYIAFSGGKDSQCIYELAKMAGVKFKAVYRVTGIDPPEAVRFIKRQYPDVVFDIPKDNDGKRITMWSLIAKKKMPPTQIIRYCCEKLKESGGVGRLTVTGVRWAESARRKHNQGLATVFSLDKKTRSYASEYGFNINERGGVVLNDDNADSRRMVEHCYRTRKTLFNPIVDWEDEDVWYFLNEVAKVPHCELYDEGYDRIGCIGCPMGLRSKRIEELERYPKYKALYLKAFEHMIEERNKSDLVNEKSWNTPEEVMEWWLDDK